MTLTLDFQGQIFYSNTLGMGRSIGLEWEMWVGYNVGCTMDFLLGHNTLQIDQFPTCWPMNGLFVHWSMGWGVSSFSERLIHHVPIILSSWNFQELLPWTEVMSMQKVKVRGQRSRSRRSTPNLAVSGLQFEFTYGNDIMHTAGSSIEEVPYCF